MTTFEFQFINQVAADLHGLTDVTEEVITQAMINRCNRNTELAHEMRTNKHYKEALSRYVYAAFNTEEETV